jgi:hypothetical protein
MSQIIHNPENVFYYILIHYVFLKIIARIKLLILLHLILLIQGCSQIYDPELEKENATIVIEALITNYPGESYVNVFKTVTFNSADSKINISDAIVEIIESSDKVFRLQYNENGEYKNNEFSGQPGYSYLLRVTSSDNEIYESSTEIMNDTYKQDSIYAFNQYKYTYHTEPNGKIVENRETGIETFVNLKSNDRTKPRCRYKIYVTGLYSYLTPGIIAHRVYGWKTFDITNNSLNITHDIKGAKPGEVKNHVAGFFTTDIKAYCPIERRDLALMGFLFKLKKYNLSENAYKYYINVENQLNSSQKLFDPLPSQLIGNIKCVNKNNKLVLGIFDVSSREDLFYDLYPGNQIRIFQVDSFQYLTNEGEKVDTTPPFWLPPR